MTLRSPRLCVVGAGIAGLACTLAAQQRGAQVQLVDEAPAPRALPASIDIVPGMLRDLAALGVADDCVRAGFAYHGIDVLDRHGRHLFELATERLAGPRLPAALGIRHADLHAVLEAAARRGGVDIRRGARVESIADAAGGARVRLADGPVLEADIVLLATGARSPLRAAQFPRARPVQPLGQVWHYALVRRPDGLDRPLVTIGGPGQRAMVLPVHHDAAGIAVTEPATMSHDGLPAAAALRHALEAFAPALRELASRIGDATPVASRPVLAGVLDSPWHHGPALAVGDGAHALPPHFGQAAAQSVEDARVLGELLTETADRAALFDAFERRRGPRVRAVHEMAMTAARWDLAPHGGADLSLLMQRLMRTVAQPA